MSRTRAAPRVCAALAVLAALVATGAAAGCAADVDLGQWRADASTLPDTAPPGPPDPCVSADPYLVDFGVVQRDIEAEVVVRLINRCDTPRAWLGLKLAGDPGFAVVIGGATYRPSTALATTGVHWVAARAVPAHGELSLLVRYQATTAGLNRAHLILLVDDPGQPTGLAVRLQAGGEAPCLALFPKSIDFGGKVVGETAVRSLELRGCGAVPVEIEKLSLDGAPGPDGAPQLGLRYPAGLVLPYVLSPDERVTLEVTYRPAEPSPGWPDAPPVWTVGTLRVVANDFERLHTVDVRGFGVLEACPEARISLVDGLDVVPVGTTVRLDGGGSVAVDGRVTAYAWSVQAPFPVSPLLPAADGATVSYRLAVAGDYAFALDVVDGSGRHACVPAVQAVRAEALAALRVELMWQTPNDPDPFDEGFELGADLDLHLVHPYAVGPDLDGDGLGDAFFDLPYDTFFANPEPRWGALGESRDPRLTLDDQDGTGPEVIEITELGAELALGIGVHTWTDNGYGPSAAVVRVFAAGTLIYESAPVTLRDDELWDVGRLRWPGPEVVPASGPGGGPRIIGAVRESGAARKP